MWKRNFGGSFRDGEMLAGSPMLGRLPTVAFGAFERRFCIERPSAHGPQTHETVG
jgi:hypothetical protein